jgi:hypothetical protein
MPINSKYRLKMINDLEEVSNKQINKVRRSILVLEEKLSMEMINTSRKLTL